MAVAGREGVGKIVEIGKDVTEKVMNKVVSIPDAMVLGRNTAR